jgi:hypothetical protein
MVRTSPACWGGTWFKSRHGYPLFYITYSMIFLSPTVRNLHDAFGVDCGNSFPHSYSFRIHNKHLKLVVCILLRGVGQVQGFRLTQHWFEYFI